MRVTDLSMFNTSPKSGLVLHIQLSEDPAIFPNPQSALISVPVCDFYTGTTRPNGCHEEEILRISDTHENSHYKNFARALRDVIDMRSIFIDLIATETLTIPRSRWIRLWNQRTMNFIKFKVLRPEEISEKQFQILLSNFLRSGESCEGNIRIGFPWQ